MRSVFEAIAHHNPYPKNHFDTHRWNHMVLEGAVHRQSSRADPGADERANEELARIMLDFAHERWAAAARFLRDLALRRALCPVPRWATWSGAGVRSVLEQQARTGLAASPDPAAGELLRRYPAIAADAAGGRLTWAVLQ